MYSEKGENLSASEAERFSRVILYLLRRDGGEHVVLAALDEEKDIILILGLLNLLNQIVRIFYRLRLTSRMISPV